jgi:hypothetical protein
MKIRLVLLILAFAATSAHSQNFIQHLQTKAPSGATVTVHEDAKIDELINNTSKPTTPTTPTATATKPKIESHVEKKVGIPEKRETPAKHHSTTTTNETKPRTTAQQQVETEKRHTNANDTPSIKTITADKAAEEDNDEDMEIATVDLRKKVMRKSYKVTGYRVQVFAGGNSRQDRLKAERIGNDVKMNFPDQPVYTHFYPPRWICRIGNFRSYSEANSILRQVKRLGYGQACIVKGKISVQY